MNYLFTNTIKVFLISLLGFNFQSVITNIHDSKKITSSLALINIVKPYPLKRHLLSWNIQRQRYQCLRIGVPRNAENVYPLDNIKSYYVDKVTSSKVERKPINKHIAYRQNDKSNCNRSSIRNNSQRTRLPQNNKELNSNSITAEIPITELPVHSNLQYSNGIYTWIVRYRLYLLKSKRIQTNTNPYFLVAFIKLLHRKSVPPNLIFVTKITEKSTKLI